jgi:hypothetical protein
MKFQYIFDCPIHGLEQQAFCFRAFQIENIDLWKKFSLIEVLFEPGEKEKLFKELKEEL